MTRETNQMQQIIVY